MNKSTKSPLGTKISMEENSNHHGRGLGTESSSWMSLQYEMSDQLCQRGMEGLLYPPRESSR
jgi:hypothetical protein